MTIKICKIEGCKNKIIARGWCRKHYERWRVHGDPNKTMRLYHGHASRGNTSKEYRSYQHMLDRCCNKRNPNYKNYGGRGISVCKAWRHSFLAFYADMGDCPEGLTLDRVDNNGDYLPENCKWASRTEQSRNRRNCRMNIIAAHVIRWLLKNTNISQKQIVSAYGVSKSVVSNIYSNKTWK